MKKTLTIALFVILTLATTACSNETETQTVTTQETFEVAIPTPETPQQSDEATIQMTNTAKTIETIMGTVEIPEDIQRITVLQPAYNEALHSLGIYPTASVCEGTTYPDVAHYMVEGADYEIINIGWQSSDANINLEAILETEPDLIFSSAQMPESYEALSQIAPTVVVDHATVNDEGYRVWDTRLLAIAEIFDKTSEATKVIDDYNTFVSESKDKIADVVEGKNAMVLRVTSNDIRYYTAQGMGQLYQGLGVATSPMIPDISVMFEAISAEYMLEINPDYLFVIVQDDVAYEELKSTPIWESLEVVQNDRVLDVSYQDWFMGAGEYTSRNVINECLELFLR